MKDKYRLRTEEELSEIAKGLREFASVLDGFPFKWHLANGVLLGAYRDGDLIPWDSDVDIDAKAEELVPHAKQVVASLKATGFRVKVKRYKKKIIKITGYKYNHMYALKAWRKHKKGMRKYWDLIYVPVKHFDNTGTVELRGVKYPCPAQTEKYLEHVYGRDWKTPFKVDRYTDCYTKKFHVRGKL